MRKSIVYTFVACLLISAMPYSVSADASEDIPANAAATGVHDTLVDALTHCLLYTSPSPRDAIPSRMPSSA